MLTPLPSWAVAVIVAVPAEEAVTRPDWLTLATPGLLLLQVSVLLAAIAGDTVAFSYNVSPAFSTADVWLIIMLVTG